MNFPIDTPLGMIEPLLIVSGVAIALLLLDLVLPFGKKHLSMWVALGGIVWALWRTLAQWGLTERGYAGMVALDTLSTFFNVLFLASTGVVVLLSHPVLHKEDVEHSEYY